MITPPSPSVAARQAARAASPSTPRRVGLDEGWTEEELVTTHYRPSEPADESEPELSLPALVRPATPRLASPTQPHEPAASLVDAYELDADSDADVDVVEAPDAADCTEVEAKAGTITVTEARVPDWEPGAPVELAELVDTDAGSRVVPPSDDTLTELDLELGSPSLPPVLDRTMLTPQPALASFATTSSPFEDDDELGPARTGKTMVVHVQDLITAYAPLDEPGLDLPEPTAPITAPTTMPRLSDELQAALERLRRRDTSPSGTPVAKSDAEEPAPRPTTARRRRRAATQAYATTRRDDTQVRALYHAALANLGDSERGDGS